MPEGQPVGWNSPGWRRASKLKDTLSRSPHALRVVFVEVLVEQIRGQRETGTSGGFVPGLPVASPVVSPDLYITCCISKEMSMSVYASTCRQTPSLHRMCVTCASGSTERARRERSRDHDPACRSEPHAPSRPDAPEPTVHHLGIDHGLAWEDGEYSMLLTENRGPAEHALDRLRTLMTSEAPLARGASAPLRPDQ